MPENPARNNNTESHNGNKNPKWWNPVWTVVLGVVLALYVVALFIACRYWVGHPNDTPAFVSGVIGILTLYAIIVQVAINRHQWRAMREGLDQQRELFDLVERPSLGIERATITLEANKPTFAYITVKNSGRAPAKNFVSTIFILPKDELAEDGGCPEPNPPPVEGRVTRSVIPVNGMRHGHAKTNAPSVDGIQRIMDGEKLVFVYMNCTYESFSGKQYFLTYYAQYHPETNSLAECEKYNDAN